MATIAPAARFENIEKSLNVYLNTQLVTGLGLTVVYQRAERLGTLPTQWIEVDFLPLSDVTFVSRSSSGRHGAISEFLVNLNCFELDDARFDGALTLYTLSAVVDQVRDAFAPTATIVVRDYNTGGTPIVGGMIPTRFPESTTIPTAPDAAITQVNVSVTLRYVAESID